MHRRVIVLLGLLTACGEEAELLPAPPERDLPELRAIAFGEGESVVLDGTSADAVWERARELVVALEGGSPAEVRLKAAHDGETLFLLAMWRDPERSLDRFWKHLGGDRFEKHLGEDAFAVLWSPGALKAEFRAQGCALFCHDDRHVFPASGRGRIDGWYWGAQQTALFPQARDLQLPFGSEQRLRGDAQPEGSDNLPNESLEYDGPAYFPKFLRAGSDRYLTADNVVEITPRILTEKLTRNPEGGREIPLDVLRARGGSRGDVRVAARHYEGSGWVLELARALDTGQSDDLRLDVDPLVPYLFGVAVCDGCEASRHARSGPLALRLLASE